jgi:hypothetical protein
MSGRFLRTLPLALSLFLASPFAQSEAENLLEKKTLIAEIEKTRLAISRTDSLILAEAKRHAQTTQLKQKERESRSEELAKLVSEIESTTRSIQQERAKELNQKSSLDNQKLSWEALRERYIGFCNQLLQSMEATLAWDLEERTERVRILRKDLELGTASLEEAHNRLEALYREEIRFGDEVEFYTRSVVTPKGETVQARILRLGNVGALYISDDGSQYGISIPGSRPLQWKDGLSFNEREAVRRALDMKQSRIPPSLAILPIINSHWILPEKRN